MECSKKIKLEQSYKIDGKKIKLARVEMDWSISKLADESGVTRKTIGEIERGSKVKVRFSTIEQIAATLGKDVNDFRKTLIKQK
ncbi:helix-turn-helix transcriptional regulator [Anaerobacillus sp. CMMVII]|uniref:helix-turn-helix transcriptional regulator n=1 Tax=Anaerobacillus sp. CMMVII TaxID=2755588 RepID=UPI0021B7EFE8|nr:helix-turn-helix transcriptional regulator [Anaerobacillus sp. CMMVII]MCT8136470.1 helix-turn-helix transcriptional regulator [Anaerobacillus sp. CMMVII]